MGYCHGRTRRTPSDANPAANADPQRSPSPITPKNSTNVITCDPLGRTCSYEHGTLSINYCFLYWFVSVQSEHPSLAVRCAAVNLKRQMHLRRLSSALSAASGGVRESHGHYCPTTLSRLPSKRGAKWKNHLGKIDRV